MATEKRLIDANALLEKLLRMIDYCKTDNKVSGLTALFQVGDAIIDCPTVDAVPVVRCRDCKHFNDVSAIPVIADSKKLVCMKGVNWRAVEPNHFCSYGERRTDNG